VQPYENGYHLQIIFSDILKPVMRIYLVILFGLFVAACDSSQDVQEASAEQALVEDPGQVTVYSSRAEHLIKPLFDQFTDETGIEVRYITDSEAALITRLEAEAERTPADMFLTVDAGNLWYASSLDLMQPVQSSVLQNNVPENLRASDNTWFSLSIRARTMVYSTDRVMPEELDSYESLAEENWSGRLCLRTSKKVYNQSLVASMIAEHGEEDAEQVVAGWVENLAIDPLNNDNKAMEAVIAGVCDVTLVNTYYFGRLVAETPDVPIDIFWANQSDRGVHVNVSGAGITKHAKNPEAAQKLLEWLSSEAAQSQFAGLNKEFPVNPAVDPVPEVAAWGPYQADDVAVEILGQLQQDAVRLMDRVGYK